MEKKYLYPIVFLGVLLFGSCSSRESRIEREPRINLVKYKGIDRSLSLLQNSTSENPNELSILFYGQSIIGGLKADVLVDSLRKEFPTANISFSNTAIGGFTAPSLLKTANHDVYHINPDLIIFHAYEDKDEKAMDTLIRTIRQRTSADIVLFNHHYVWNTNKISLDAENRRDSIQSIAIGEIAAKYDCHYINVRSSWKKYLDENAIGANILIGNTIDTDVHPNEKGKELLREIILANLLEENEVSYSAKNDGLREEIKLTNSRSYDANIEGNLVEIGLNEVVDTITQIEVLIDRKKPSAYRNSFYISRPSVGFKSWMPVLKLVSLGDTMPRKEDWTVIITNIDRENKYFSYRIEGSITGFDGEGNSNADFISNTNRIKINKDDFYLFRIEKIIGQETPDNFEINFTVKQLVEDTIKVNPNTLSYAVFRDFESKEHALRLNILTGKSKLNDLTMYRPYLEKNE